MQRRDKRTGRFLPRSAAYHHPPVQSGGGTIYHIDKWVGCKRREETTFSNEGYRKAEADFQTNFGLRPPRKMFRYRDNTSKGLQIGQKRELIIDLSNWRGITFDLTTLLRAEYYAREVRDLRDVARIARGDNDRNHVFMLTGYKSLLDKIRKRGKKKHGNLFQDSDLANGARTTLVKYAIINPNVHALYIGLKEYAFDVFKRYVAGEDKAAQDYATLEKATVGIIAKGSSLNMFQILHYTCTHILAGSIDHGSSFSDSYECGTPNAEAPSQETEYTQALSAKNEVEKVRSWRTFRLTNDTLVGDDLLNKMDADEFKFEDAPEEEPRDQNSTASVEPSHRHRICGPRYAYKQNTDTSGSLVRTLGMPDATFCQRVPGTCLYKRRGGVWTCCPKTKAPVFGYDDCSVPLRERSKRVQTLFLKRLFMALNKDNEDAFVDEGLIDNTIKPDDKCITTNTDNQIIAVVVTHVKKGEVTVKRIGNQRRKTANGKRRGRGNKVHTFNVRPHELVKLTDVDKYATFMKTIQGDRDKALELLREMLDSADLASITKTAMPALAIGDVVVYYKNEKLWVATVVSQEASKVTVTRKNTKHPVDIDIGDILSRHELCKSARRLTVGTKVVVQKLDWFDVDVDLNKYITDKGELRDAFVGEVKPRKKKGKKRKDSHGVQRGTKTITVDTNLIYRPLD